MKGLDAIPDGLATDAAAMGDHSPTLAEAEGLRWWENRSILHLYPQYAYHGEASLIGTVEALEDLRDAIDVALLTGRSEIKTMTSDGEGYCLHVERTNETGMGYTRLPYIADFARCDEPDYAKTLRDRIAELEGLLAKREAVVPHAAQTPAKPSGTNQILQPFQPGQGDEGL